MSADTASNTIKTLLDIASRKYPIQDTDKFVKDLNVVSSELGEAAQKLVEADFDYRPKKENRMAAEAAHAIYDSASIEDLATNLVRVIKSGEPIDRDMLAVYLDVAVKHGGGLQKKDPNQQNVVNDFKALDKFVKQQNLPDAAYTSFMRSLYEGKSSTQAVEIAKKSGADALNPTGKAYTVGQILTNSRGESGEVISISPQGVPMIKRHKKVTNAKQSNSGR